MVVAGLLLRREGRHPRHPRGPRVQERDREMLEAGRRLRRRFHRRHRRPSMRRATARSSSRPMQYPHGPITVRITGENGTVKDNCYLQLYNKGGVSWNEGMPKDRPPAARGMKLVFADDFSGPLSISSTDPKATYYDHKPPNGYQDFSVHTFSGHDSPKNPFAQVDSYLRIRASDKTHSSGPDLLDEERRQRHQGLGSRVTSSAGSSARTPSAPGRASGS